MSFSTHPLDIFLATIPGKLAAYERQIATTDDPRVLDCIACRTVVAHMSPATASTIADTDMCLACVVAETAQQLRDLGELKADLAKRIERVGEYLPDLLFAEVEAALA